MRCAFVPFVLFASSAFALPANSTVHFLSKRDNVCAQNFRAAVKGSDCIPKGISFTQNGAAVTKATGVTAEPADHQCDHNIEIQFLDKNLKGRGICTAISKLGSVTTNPSAATLLQPLLDIISKQENLNFLSTAVNGKKRALVASGRSTATDDTSKAVGSFLRATSAESLGVAGQLDAAVATMITRMKAVSAANLPPAPPAKGRAPRLSTADAAKKALVDALAPASLRDAATDKVRAQWQTLINSAPQ
jgi:hypothetical protein